MSYAILVQKHHNQASSNYIRECNPESGFVAYTTERDAAETWSDELQAHDAADAFGGHVVKI